MFSTICLNHSCRKLEDKLQAVRVALRPFTLNLNVDDLHKNRESPSAFMCYLGVIDSSLPVKGTAHRKVRGTPEVESSVNELPEITLVHFVFFASSLQHSFVFNSFFPLSPALFSLYPQLTPGFAQVLCGCDSPFLQRNSRPRSTRRTLLCQEVGQTLFCHMTNAEI
jgi:hypothetical protein